jgi:hypothetical protein
MVFTPTEYHAEKNEMSEVISAIPARAHGACEGRVGCTGGEGGDAAYGEEGAAGWAHAVGGADVSAISCALDGGADV